MFFNKMKSTGKSREKADTEETYLLKSAEAGKAGQGSVEAGKAGQGSGESAGKTAGKSSGKSAEKTAGLSVGERVSKAELLLSAHTRRDWSKLRGQKESDNANVTGFFAWKHRQGAKLAVARRWLGEHTDYLEVWRGSFKLIEGNYGSGVVSYFIFLKWLLFLNLYMVLLLFFFVVFPHVAFKAQPYDEFVAGRNLINGSNDRTERADNCTARTATGGHQTDVLHVVLDTLQGTGWMERRALFYGFYEDRRYTLVQTPEYSMYYNLPLAYILVVLVIFFISLVLMVKNTAQSMRENILGRKGKHTQYCGVIFGGWDYSLESDESITLKHKSIYNEVAGKLEEERDSRRRLARTFQEEIIIVVVRILLNVVIIALLCASGYLIVFATLSSQQFTQRLDYHSISRFVRLLMEYVPSVTITSVSFIIPQFLSRIAKLEDYHKETQLRLTLMRTVFLKMASLAILLATIYSQVTCRKQRDWCNVGYGKCPTLPCWETYVGQQIYKLVIMDFISSFLGIFLLDFPKRLLGIYGNAKIFKIISRQEFEVPKFVLELVYGQTLCWLGIFFCPLLPAVCMIKNFIIFYLKKLTLFVNCSPPDIPYQASRSNMFFTVILLIAYIGCCLPIGFVIFSIEPSHGCGPFRLYGRDYEIWTITVDSFPQVVRAVINLVFSPSFFCIALIAVVMMLYYTRQLVAVHKDIERVMMNKLALERTDKQYLLKRLMEYTGEKEETTKAQPPPPAPR